MANKEKCPHCKSTNINFSYRELDNALEYVLKLSGGARGTFAVKSKVCQDCGLVLPTANTSTLDDLMELLKVRIPDSQREKRYKVMKSVALFWQYNSRLLSSTDPERALAKALKALNITI